ncbi:MAG: hypothetical protein MHM6MM_000101 [Cercozoa sp. M6MM]
MHSSAYMYLETLSGSLVCLAYLVYRLIQKRHELLPTLAWSRLKNDVRTVCVILISVSTLCLTIYAILGSFVKYSEGYSYNVECNDTNNCSVTKIRPKHPSEFNRTNVRLMRAAHFVANLSFTCKTSTVFLLSALLHYVTMADCGFRTFNETWHAKAVTYWSMFSLLLYPTLQLAFQSLEDDGLVLPLFVYCAELVLAILLIRAVVLPRLFSLLNTASFVSDDALSRTDSAVDGQYALSPQLRYRLLKFAFWLNLLWYSLLVELIAETVFHGDALSDTGLLPEYTYVLDSAATVQNWARAASFFFILMVLLPFKTGPTSSNCTATTLPRSGKTSASPMLTTTNGPDVVTVYADSPGISHSDIY